MIKAIIIDDEPLARSIVKEYLAHHAEVEVVEECNNGFEGVKAIGQHQPDLIFLDVQMPKINGFEMLELLDQRPPVIFTTAYDEYAMKAFDEHAVDYLLKPFSRERFEKAFGKWMEQRGNSGSAAKTETLLSASAVQPDAQQRVVVKTGNNIRIIPVHEIHYLEAYDDYVKIHTADGYFLKKKTMQYFEDALPASQFVRVHRSYIVQIPQITRIQQAEKDSHAALLKSGAKVPLSKAGYSKLRGVLGM